MGARLGMIVLAVVMLVPVMAQAPGEVVSIRPAKASGQVWTIRAPKGGRFTAEHVPLGDLVLFAYGVQSNRIDGLPGWANEDHFTINIVPAVPERPGTEALSEAERLAKAKPEIQKVLAEHFGLRAHWVTKPGKIYLLEVVKGGAKLTPVPVEELKAHPFARIGGGVGAFVATAADIGTLATQLSYETGHDVKDETGLMGRYNITLRWQPLHAAAAPAGAVALPATVFAALKEELGLELKPAEGRIRYLVVDHIGEFRP